MAEIIDRPTNSETYQPLSLLALAGFGLAVVYALVVLIGGAISLLSHVPWLMPKWTFMIPIAVLVVCWAARGRILNSEGTLSGLTFTTWGSRLAILFGITYVAYYAATFFAVRGPAIDCANDFFRQVKEGRADRAFLTAQGISIKGMSDSDLRDMLELKFNQPGGMRGEPGAFTRFHQERFVRFLEMDGEKANFTPLGVAFWEYGKGGYRVVLNYHIVTALVEFDMKVETFGRDPKPGEPKGPKWQVILLRSETGILPETVEVTRPGEEILKKIEKAQNFAMDWAAKFNDVDTLSPAERESYSKLIRIDDKTFWAGKQQRADILKRIEKTLQPSTGGNRITYNLSVASGSLPLMRENDGRTMASIDMGLRYYEEGSPMPLYLVDGRLQVSAESSAAANSSAAWRVDALDIESGRTPPEDRRRPSSPPQ